MIIRLIPTAAIVAATAVVNTTAIMPLAESRPVMPPLAPPSPSSVREAALLPPLALSSLRAVGSTLCASLTSTWPISQKGREDVGVVSYTLHTRHAALRHPNPPEVFEAQLKSVTTESKL